MSVKTPRLLIAVVAFVAVIGGCIAVVCVHDARSNLNEGEFRERVHQRVAVGGTEAEVASFLADLRAARPHDATVDFYPPKTVKQEDCFPRPCSLVDRGVEPGVESVTARVENVRGWVPTICTDEYIVLFIFDQSRRYSRLLFKDASACL